MLEAARDSGSCSPSDCHVFPLSSLMDGTGGTVLGISMVMWRICLGTSNEMQNVYRQLVLINAHIALMSRDACMCTELHCVCPLFLLFSLSLSLFHTHTHSSTYTHPTPSPKCGHTNTQIRTTHTPNTTRRERQRHTHTRSAGHVIQEEQAPLLTG